MRGHGISWPNSRLSAARGGRPLDPIAARKRMTCSVTQFFAESRLLRNSHLVKLALRGLLTLL